MGDQADALIEQGEAEWYEHLAGNCRDICPYCEEEFGKKLRLKSQMANGFDAEKQEGYVV